MINSDYDGVRGDQAVKGALARYKKGDDLVRTERATMDYRWTKDYSLDTCEKVKDLNRQTSPHGDQYTEL